MRNPPWRRAASSTRTLALLTLSALAISLVGLGWLHSTLASAAEGGDRYLALTVAAAWTAACCVLTSINATHPRRGLLLTAGALMLTWQFRDPLAQRIDLVYLAQHAGTHLLLGLMFLRTLLAAGGPPLVERLATRVHGPLPPAITRYTRQVTVGWTAYFLGMTLVSVLLFVCAPLPVWSLLANLVTLPLIVAGFIAEYALRLRLHPNFEHVSIFDGVRAYRSPRA